MQKYNDIFEQISKENQEYTNFAKPKVKSAGPIGSRSFSVLSTEIPEPYYVDGLPISEYLPIKWDGSTYTKDSSRTYSNLMVTLVGGKIDTDDNIHHYHNYTITSYKTWANQVAATVRDSQEVPLLQIVRILALDMHWVNHHTADDSLRSMFRLFAAYTHIANSSVKRPLFKKMSYEVIFKIALRTAAVTLTTIAGSKFLPLGDFKQDMLVSRNAGHNYSTKITRPSSLFSTEGNAEVEMTINADDLFTTRQDGMRAKNRVSRLVDSMVIKTQSDSGLFFIHQWSRGNTYPDHPVGFRAVDNDIVFPYQTDFTKQLVSNDGANFTFKINSSAYTSTNDVRLVGIKPKTGSSTITGDLSSLFTGLFDDDYNYEVEPDMFDDTYYPVINLIPIRMRMELLNIDSVTDYIADNSTVSREIEGYSSWGAAGHHSPVHYFDQLWVSTLVHILNDHDVLIDQTILEEVDRIEDIDSVLIREVAKNSKIKDVASASDFVKTISGATVTTVLTSDVNSGGSDKRENMTIIDMSTFPQLSGLTEVQLHYWGDFEGGTDPNENYIILSRDGDVFYSFIPIDHDGLINGFEFKFKVDGEWLFSNSIVDESLVSNLTQKGKVVNYSVSTIRSRSGKYFISTSALPDFTQEIHFDANELSGWGAYYLHVNLFSEDQYVDTLDIVGSRSEDWSQAWGDISAQYYFIDLPNTLREFSYTVNFVQWQDQHVYKGSTRITNQLLSTIRIQFDYSGFDPNSGLTFNNGWSGDTFYVLNGYQLFSLLTFSLMNDDQDYTERVEQIRSRLYNEGYTLAQIDYILEMGLTKTNEFSDQFDLSYGEALARIDEWQERDQNRYEWIVANYNEYINLDTGALDLPDDIQVTFIDPETGDEIMYTAGTLVEDYSLLRAKDDLVNQLEERISIQLASYNDEVLEGIASIIADNTAESIDEFTNAVIAANPNISQQELQMMVEDQIEMAKNDFRNSDIVNKSNELISDINVEEVSVKLDKYMNELKSDSASAIANLSYNAEGVIQSYASIAKTRVYGTGFNPVDIRSKLGFLTPSYDAPFGMQSSDSFHGASWGATVARYGKSAGNAVNQVTRVLGSLASKAISKGVKTVTDTFNIASGSIKSFRSHSYGINTLAYPATHVSMLNHDFYSVYTWLFNKLYPEGEFDNGIRVLQVGKNFLIFQSIGNRMEIALNPIIREFSASEVADDFQFGEVLAASMIDANIQLNALLTKVHDQLIEFIDTSLDYLTTLDFDDLLLIMTEGVEYVNSTNQKMSLAGFGLVALGIGLSFFTFGAGLAVAGAGLTLIGGSAVKNSVDSKRKDRLEHFRNDPAQANMIKSADIIRMWTSYLPADYIYNLNNIVNLGLAQNFDLLNDGSELLPEPSEDGIGFLPFATFSGKVKYKYTLLSTNQELMIQTAAIVVLVAAAAAIVYTGFKVGGKIRKTRKQRDVEREMRSWDPKAVPKEIESGRDSEGNPIMIPNPDYDKLTRANNKKFTKLQKKSKRLNRMLSKGNSPTGGAASSLGSLLTEASNGFQDNSTTDSEIVLIKNRIG